MREFIAVNDLFTFVDFETEERSPAIYHLKRQALLFDRIALPGLSEGFIRNDMVSSEYPEQVRELDWLSDNGIVFEPQYEKKTKIEHKDYLDARDELRERAKRFISLMIGFDFDDLTLARDGKMPMQPVKEKIDRIPQRGKILMELAESEEFLETIVLMMGAMTRLNAIRLRETLDVEACPIFNRVFPIAELPRDKDSVLRIVLNVLPMPDDSTSWEQIMEFRNDPDSQNKFLDLRNWMREIARAELTPIEMEEKLEYLLSRYRRHMELHKMKIKAGTLETVLVTTGEILENVAHLDFGKAAKALFSVRHRKISLIEGELTSPGNELAYIMKAQENFQ